jgi:hypothetical protein
MWNIVGNRQTIGYELQFLFDSFLAPLCQGNRHQFSKWIVGYIIVFQFQSNFDFFFYFREITLEVLIFLKSIHNVPNCHYLGERSYIGNRK